MKLKRKLQLFDVCCIATGTMISAGLFTLPGIAFAQIGPLIFVSYLLAGVLCLISILNQAELVSAMPKAGGAYFYFARSMGPAAGAIYGLTIWFSLAMKSAFALLGMALMINSTVNIDFHVIAIILCLFFIILNIIGIREASMAQNIMVVILLGSLFLYMTGSAAEVKMVNFSPLSLKNISSIALGIGFIFISYGGLIEVTSIAEEVEAPRKTMPAALIISILVVMLFYTLTVFVTIGVLDAAKLRVSLSPVCDAAAIVMGGLGRKIMVLAATLAFVTTANGGLMAASHYPVAGAKDGLLPRFLSKFNHRFKTPHFSIISTGAFIILALLLDLENLVKIASSVAMLTYLFSFLPVLIFRASHLKNYKPLFKTPFYPWLQVIGIIVYVFLLIHIGWQALWINIVIVSGGIVAYMLYAFCKNKKEHAGLYLLEKFLGKKCTRGDLESEFKRILEEDHANNK